MFDQVEKIDDRLTELGDDRTATLARQAAWQVSGDVVRADQEAGRLLNLSREVAYLQNERQKWAGAAPITIQR